MRRTVTAWITAASLGLVACGGPREVSSRVKVAVETTPPGAMITVRDATGERAIGRAPLEHEVEYVESVYESSPGYWITTGIVAAATIVGTALVVGGMGDDIRDSDGAVLRNTDDTGMIAGGITALTVGGTTLLIMLPLAIIDGTLDGDVLWSMPKNGATTYAADLAGHRGATTILDPSKPQPWKVQLALAEDEENNGLVAIGSTGGGLGVLGGVVGSGLVGPAPFVAVFDIDDRTGTLDARAVATLTDQLATKLAEARAFRVVPAADLRARLADAKKESYRACVDERCQIELGKAVAADRTLAVRVMQAGAICTVNGVVYDLKTEATERAASVRGGCGIEALVDAVDALAAKLSTD